jgi:TRAP-type C4-dicarboxylate transport system permease large subunit
VTCRIADISVERCFPYILQVVAVMIAALIVTILVPAMSLWPTW